MKDKIDLMIVFVVLSSLLAGCGGQEAVPTVDEAAAPAVEIVLKIGEGGFTRAELEGMDTLVAEATKKDGSTVEYAGVLVCDVLDAAGVDGTTVVFIAGDGYEAELSKAELADCADCIVAFDGDELRVVLPGFPGNVQVKGIVEIAVK